MTEANLKELLSRLHEALEDTEKVDDETLKLVQELDEDINRLLEADDDDGLDSVMDHAQSMEARFAVEHPVAERFLREIMDALARVGI
jgi:mevalonate kinase